MRSLLLDAFRARVKDAQSLPEPRWGGGVYDELYEPESRLDFVEAYRDRIWVQRSVNLVSKASTQVEIEVRTGNDWTDEHRLIDLVRQPNPRDPALLFFEWSILWSQVVGDWFWEIIPARDGGISQLFPLRSHHVRVKKGEGGYPGGYVYRPWEQQAEPIQFQALRLDPTQREAKVPTGDEHAVLAGRFPSPLDDYYGMPPLRGAKDDVVSEYYAVRYDHRFFRNSARPDIVVGFKGRLEADQRRENREAWQDFKGVERAHKAAILDGDPTVTTLTANQRDVEYLNGRKLAREGQCAAFGVPPVLIGILDHATYSNYQEAKIVFWMETMVPLLEFFASWANATLVPFFPDVDEIAFNTREVPALQQAEGWRVERIQGEIESGLLTPNEGREMLDREPDDADEASSLHLPVKLIPLGLRPVSKTGQPPLVPSGEAEAEAEAAAAAAAGETDQTPSPNGGDPAKAIDERLRLAAAQTARSLLADRLVKTVEQWMTKRNDAVERFTARASSEMSQHFRAQHRAIEDVIFGTDKAKSIDAVQMEQRLRSYGWDDDAAQLGRIIAALHAGMAEQAWHLVDLLIASDAEFDPDNANVSATLRQLANRSDGIASIGGRVKTAVLDEVQKGIEHGLTSAEIAKGGVFSVGPPDEKVEITLKGIRGVYDEMETWQATRIARTEAAMTFNRTSTALMREAGLTQVDIVDGDDDEGCAEANGSRWTLDEYESDPLEHPNCTRIGIPVVDIPSADVLA